MLKLLGKVYITTKEASSRYGFSVQWFQERRSDAKAPRFIQIEGRGRVYYPLDETDQWFLEELK